MTTRVRMGGREALASDARPAQAAVTMQTVARLAGVSAMTVSRALRGEALVSKHTRERVLEIVKQIGYVPDASARVFASRRSGFVAVLVPSLNNSNFAETVRGMAEIFDAAGLQMLLGDTQYSLSREESLIATFLQRRPEAMLLTGGVHTSAAAKMLARADIPIVETWETPRRPLGHVVGFSNRRAGAAMARHLHARGRRRIAFIGSGDDSDRRGFERLAGCVEALRGLGLATDRVIRVGAPPASMGRGAEALDLLLKGWPDTDGVVCVSDLIAFGVLAEAQRRGIGVPQQLALIGFGDFEVSRACHPRLTTVAVESVAIGRRAAEIVVEEIEAGADAKRRSKTIVGFKVIERETA